MKRNMVFLLIVMMLGVSVAGCAGNAKTSQTTPVTTQQETKKAETDKREEGIEQPSGYPDKNISWIVPAQAGAVLDITTRAVTNDLDLGGNVIIENMAGASNTIGTLEASQRDADGCTILTGNTSALIIQPLLLDVGYDPADFRTISLLRPLGTYCIVVNPKSGLETSDDWLKLVQSGERFTYTVPNAGNAAHLGIIKTLDELKADSGVYVSYNGTAEASAAMVNGEVDFAVLDTPDMLAKAKVGDVRVLLILDDKPDNLDLSVPTIADLGVKGIDCFYGFQCVAIRKDTPKEAAEWIKNRISKVLKSDAYQKYLVDSGAGPMEELMSEEELTSIIENARVTYEGLLKENGMIQ